MRVLKLTGYFLAGLTPIVGGLSVIYLIWLGLSRFLLTVGWVTAEDASGMALFLTLIGTPLVVLFVCGITAYGNWLIEGDMDTGGRRRGLKREVSSKLKDLAADRAAARAAKLAAAKQDGQLSEAVDARGRVALTKEKDERR